MMRRDIPIEELVATLPQSVQYLLGKGIAIIVCGEPIWGTLEDVGKAGGYTDGEIDRMVMELAGLVTAGGQAAG
jgi:hypothetical protein